MKLESLETPICNICLEPIYHFICPDCLHNQVKSWLEENASYLVPEVEEIIGDIKKHLLKNRENRVKCIHCGEEKSGFVCPFCFIREIYSGLKDIDKPKADELSNIFNFDFQGTGFYSTEEDVKNFESLIDQGVGEGETGICESCGSIQDNLKMINGKFVCEDCRFNILN